MSVDRLVVLGAGGDLTGRYLLPALAELEAADRLDGIEVVGVGFDEWGTDEFRRRADERLARHASTVPEDARRSLCARLGYRRGDVTDPGTLGAAVAADGPVVVYLALPPSVFAAVIEALQGAPLPEGSRLVLEKPFGVDLDSARHLNDLLHDALPEDRVFRVDHFLAMPTVQNLLGIRFGNRVFEPLWCAEHVESIDIVWDETVALEGRAGYYDHTGALRDMVQNHLLQLLALAAMERPRSLGEADLRDAKVELLRRVRRYDPAEAARRTVRARYGRGEVGGRRLPAYVEEPGVHPERGTETFAEVTLAIDDARWAGVPFRLRTGKALDADRRYIQVRFRPVDAALFERGHALPPNELTMAMDPDLLQLDIALNGRGDPFVLEPTHLAAPCAPTELSAYARLLIDVFDGNPALSVRGDEAEESWRIVEPILTTWSAGLVPLEEYPAGSRGPVQGRLAP